ncbi:MAG TPA: COX15/CtaA family protein, partial [Terricaulis sp.]|nr:COX15/CtaA family protein [Terricaulis sp.]
DGGSAYADWPLIGGEWIPSAAFSLDDFFANFTQEHATQHLIHRTLGYVTALFALALAGAALWRGRGPARDAAIAVGVLALAQAGLGVATVLLVSPLWISLIHQAGAVLLWIAALICLRAAWR